MPDYSALVQLAQLIAAQGPQSIPVGDVINKSGTFAAMQDANEIKRKLDILRAQRGPSGPVGIPSAGATILPLVPRPER